jgi:hypothetical protein
MGTFGFNGAAVFRYDPENSKISLFTSSAAPQPIAISTKATSATLVSLSPLLTTVVFASPDGVQYYDFESKSPKPVEGAPPKLRDLQSDPLDSRYFFAVDVDSNILSRYSLLPSLGDPQQIHAIDNPGDSFSVGRQFILYNGQVHSRSALAVPELPPDRRLHLDSQYIYVQDGETIVVLDPQGAEIDTVSNVTSLHPGLSIVLQIGDSGTFWSNRRRYKLPSPARAIAATSDALSYLPAGQTVPVIARPRRGLPSFSYDSDSSFIFDPTVAAFAWNGARYRTLADTAILTTIGVIAAENGTLFRYSETGRERIPVKTPQTGASVLKTDGEFVYWLVKGTGNLYRFSVDNRPVELETVSGAVQSFDLADGVVAAIVLENDRYRVTLDGEDVVLGSGEIGPGAAVFADSHDVYVWDAKERIAWQVDRATGKETKIEGVTAVWSGRAVVLQRAGGELEFFGTQRFKPERPVLAADFDGGKLRIWTGLGEPVVPEWTPTLTFVDNLIGQWSQEVTGQLAAAVSEIRRILKQYEATELALFLKLERLGPGAPLPDGMNDIISDVIVALLDSADNPACLPFAVRLFDNAPDQEKVVMTLYNYQKVFGRILPWLPDSVQDEYR